MRDICILLSCPSPSLPLPPSHTDHISDLQPHNIWRTKTNSIGFGGKSLKQFLHDQKLHIDILQILLLGGNFERISGGIQDENSNYLSALERCWKREAGWLDISCLLINSSNISIFLSARVCLSAE